MIPGNWQVYQKQPKQQTQQATTVVAPISGLNTLDNLRSMGQQYAINCTNWIATPQGLSVRQGYSKYVTGITGYVQSLMPYRGTSPSQNKMFAAAGTSFYDVTNSSTSPTAVQTGLSNALWESCNFSNLTKHYLVCCNGQDTARFWNGTSWTNFSFAAVPNADGEIDSGGPMTSLTNWRQVITHQMRLWIVQEGSTQAFYLPIGQLAGTPVSFDFGPYFQRGGTLSQLCSWSVDLGQGITNYLVAVSTAGDVVIYSGTNPATSSTWSLNGTWQLGMPIGKRCLRPYASDVLYLCEDGLMPLTKYLQSTRVETSGQMSYVINPTISNLVSIYGTLPGFEFISYPGNNILLLNVPQIDADQNFQFCFQTQTSGWSQFSGWGAQCWAELSGKLYFGGNGFVAHAFDGYTDGGNAYVATVQQAFNYLDDSNGTRRKRFLRARPNIITEVDQPQITMTCNIDYNLSPPVGNASLVGSSGAVWDAGRWDQATWAAGYNNFNKWQGIRGVGYCASLGLAVAVQGFTEWVATDWVFEESSING